LADVSDLVLVPLETIPATPEHTAFRQASVLPSGFWQSTSERFAYLYDYCTSANLSNTIHLENDIMLYYDISQRLPQFITKPMWAVFDSEHRCIPSVLFFRHSTVMGDFMKTFVQCARQNKNDMETIAYFRKTHPDQIGALPIITNYSEPIPAMYTEHASTFGVLFDGAAVGQYLGGIDTIHNKHNTDGFINETTVFQCNKATVEWTYNQGKKVPYLNGLPLVNLHIHSKDLQRWSSDVADQIPTGEKFQELCDVYCGTPEDFAYNPRIQAQPQKHVNLLTLNAPWTNPRRIFCYTHSVPLFIQKQDYLQNPFVLVSHNSDHTIHAEFMSLMANPKLIRWYAQNICMNHPKLQLLPIGIANSMWPHGNLDTLTKYMRYTLKTKDVYFYFNIGTNHQARSECYTTLINKGLLFGTPKPYEAYLAELSEHKYAICPDGNGVDSHRIWECYALGVIPILKASVFAKQLSQWLPCIMVESWSDVNLPAYLQAYSQMFQTLQTKATTVRMSWFAHKINHAV